ncbi:MAG: membrane dipeptidase [Acidiferrobacterales bacterium]|nr:membrane dipeptidase [Acidiferrobacterales bacterium]
MAATTPRIDALQASNWNREIFQSMVNADLDAVHVTVAFWHDCAETLKTIRQWDRWFVEHDDLIMAVKTIDDIDEARDSGRTGIILGFQNSSPIEDDLALVEAFHVQGVRIMQLTYNNQSLVGTGYCESRDSGLTNFGRNVVREMNRLGMIVDVSHTSELTCMEAIEFSERPIAVTHANPRFFCDNPRNKSNDLLVQLAASGGMLGFSLYPLHLAGGTQCSLESFCSMVAKTADLIGVEHLGLGTDLCLGWPSEHLEYMRSGTWRFPDQRAGSPVVQWPDYPPWFRKNEDLSNVSDGLSQTGFSEDEVGLIMGGNWYRFFQDGFCSA